MNATASPHWTLARRVVDLFCLLPNVEAIGLAGSQVAQAVDPRSDIDLYVYTTALIPLPQRVAIVETLGARRSDLNMQFWDLNDEWFDAETGIEVDVMYWDTAWIEGQLDRVLLEHQASLGYSTCHWHTVRNSTILYDRSGWLRGLQDKSAAPYPEALRRAIVAKNHAVLRRVIPSYLGQIEKAVRRHDVVSINHRVAALLASYFDVLFAVNRLPHPGEKRLLQKAGQCAKVPRGMVQQVENVLRAASAGDGTLLVWLTLLLDGLDDLLREEGLDYWRMEPDRRPDGSRNGPPDESGV